MLGKIKRNSQGTRKSTVLVADEQMLWWHSVIRSHPKNHTVLSQSEKEKIAF